MALSATVYNFEIDLADVDRGVYESLALRVARHPSETEEYLLTRVLAYCLEYSDGIAFTRGLADPDEPAIAVRDLTGTLRAWVDIGTPDAARLHKASKAAARVAVYGHRGGAYMLRPLEGERIHRAEALEIYSIERELVSGLVSRLERRMRFQMSVTERHLFLSLESATLNGAVERLAIP